MTVTDPDLTHCVGVTCSRDGRQHQIPDTVLAAELAAGSGRLPALCGGFIMAASMTAPPGLPAVHRRAPTLRPPGEPDPPRVTA